MAAAMVLEQKLEYGKLMLANSRPTSAMADLCHIMGGRDAQRSAVTTLGAMHGRDFGCYHSLSAAAWDTPQAFRFAMYRKRRLASSGRK